MTPTFVVYQVSSRETIRYEIPTALQWVFDEWRDTQHVLVVNTPRGTRLRPRTVQQRLDSLRPEFDELLDQVKVTKKPTHPVIAGHKPDLLYFDYPI